ncbi:hypothetical protein DUI87_21341 [Hirundo rustica rustica]|uniref:Uncharacterized protein n=1 Tax=Hirundo rustica rustica TaxID=333673 RepID=A0A3M0JSU6_HIRRU|nr:hypothetical protein DUI87_21341 [Hirundo rustica rustica]
MAGERTRRFTRSLLRPGQAAELRHGAAAAAAGGRLQLRCSSLLFPSWSVEEVEGNSVTGCSAVEAYARKLNEIVPFGSLLLAELLAYASK